MVRRVVVTIPTEHADEVVATLDRTRHCHNLTIVHGESGNTRGVHVSGIGSETPLRQGTCASLLLRFHVSLILRGF